MGIITGLLVLVLVLALPAVALAGGLKLQQTLRVGTFLLCAVIFGFSCFLAGVGSVYFTQPPQGIYQTHYANKDLMSAIAFISAHQAREGKLPTSPIFRQYWEGAHGNKGYTYAPSYPKPESLIESDKAYRIGIWEGDDFLYYDSVEHVFYYGEIGTKGNP